MDRSGRERRRRWLSGGILLALLVGAPATALMLVVMPGRSHAAKLPPLTTGQLDLRDELQRDLEVLAGEIGPRSAWHPENLVLAAAFLEEQLAEAGYEVHRQEFRDQELTFANLEVELPGAYLGEEIVVIGAHYDSVGTNCPGANDNGTGVVALLALARRFGGTRPPRTLRFVLFVNEEPPFFQGPAMGSNVYARRCRERGEKVVAMLSLETLGYYSDEDGSQKYPPVVGWFYPSTANFIACVGNVRSRGLVRRVIRTFREVASIPSEGAALPAWIPGIGWSDQWSFWQQGYDAVMVTDTAPYRYPWYHTHEDTIDKIDFDRLARVVDGLEPVIAELAGSR